MTQRYYGLNNANIDQYQPDKVTVGTSTGSTDIELRIDDTKKWTQEKIIQALEALENRIMDGRFTDAGIWVPNSQ